MNNILIKIKKYIILLYILNILVPCNLSNYLNKKNKKILDIINQKRYISEFIDHKNMNRYNVNITFAKYKDKNIDIKFPSFDLFPYEKDIDKHYDDDDDDDHDREPSEDEERRKQEIYNISSQIKELDDKIGDLNNKITKSKIYIAFLAILAIILFLIIVIYCSIKCYILCTKKNLQNYRVSYISENRLGEVYIDENGEERFCNSIIKNKDECEAPIYSSSNVSKNVSTFNPDNYKASDEDKNLYKPYNSQDIL